MNILLGYPVCPTSSICKFSFRSADTSYVPSRGLHTFAISYTFHKAPSWTNRNPVDAQGARLSGGRRQASIFQRKPLDRQKILHPSQAANSRDSGGERQAGLQTTFSSKECDTVRSIQWSDFGREGRLGIMEDLSLWRRVVKLFWIPSFRLRVVDPIIAYNIEIFDFANPKIFRSNAFDSSVPCDAALRGGTPKDFVT